MAITAGVDLEWAVVELVRAHQGKPLTLPTEYTNTIHAQAKKCNTHLFNILGEQFDIYHSDESIPGIEHISGKPEPKTDIVVVKETQVYYISVKMDGKIQLTSGQGKSSAELFEAAGSVTGEQSDEFRALVTDLRNLPTKLLAQAHLARVLREGSPDTISELTANGQIIETKSYDIWNRQHRVPLMTSLLSFVNQNPEFYAEVIREALTGAITLNDCPGAVATHVLSPNGFFPIDMTYINKIREKVFMDIRAKSRKGITSVTLRMESFPVKYD